MLSERDSSATVDSVFLVPMSETKPDGSVVRSYWQTQFFLADRPYDIEVLIDRETGQVAVGKVHKPL